MEKKVFIIISCIVILCLICFQSLIIYSLIGFLPIFKILIVETSLLPVLTCLLGCSVYHVQMWRDSNSASNLLNNLYTITAVIMQVQSIMLGVLILADNFCPNNQNMINVVSVLLWFSRVLNFFHMIALTTLIVFKQYRPTEYLDISVDPRGKWIIFSFEFFVSFLFVFLQVWNDCFENWNFLSECSINSGLRIFGPITMLFCVFILLKVAEDGYGLWKRTSRTLIHFKKRAAFLSRQVTARCITNNLVTPFNEEQDDEVQYHSNDDQVD